MSLHPMIDLLRRFVKPKCPDVSDNPELLSFFAQCALPIVDRQSIADVEAVISLPNAVLADSLAPIASLFHFDILVLKIYTDRYLGSWDLIPLAHCIAWLSTSDPKSISAHFHYLLDGLMNLPPETPKAIAQFTLKAAILRYLEVETGPWPLDICLKLFPSCEPCLCDILTLVYARTPDCEVRNFLIITLRRSIFENPANYATCNFAALITHMHKSFAEFDVNSLMLLTVMATVRSDGAVLNAVALLPSYIQASLALGLELPPMPQAVHFGSIAFDFNLDFEDTLPVGLTPCDLSVFDEIGNIDSITSSVHNRFRALFGGFLLSLETEYIIRFVDAFADLRAEIANADLFVFFLLILAQSEIKLSPHVLSVLIRSAVFNSAITIFEVLPENHRIVILLRNSVIEFLLRVQLDSMEDILKRLAASPLVFADVVTRVHHRLGGDELRQFLTEGTVTTIIRVFLVLREFYKDNKTSPLIRAVQLARSSIFLFFFYALQDRGVRNTCFRSFPFVGGFLSRALEPSVQISILSAFSAFVISPDASVLVEPALRVIYGMFHVCRSTIHPSESHLRRLGIDLIILLNEALVMNPLLAAPLQSVVRPVIAFLNSDPSCELVTHVLNMISHLHIASDAFRLSYSQIHEICSAVRRIEPTGASDETISILLGLINLSKNVTATHAPMFLVKRSSLIVLLFSLVRTHEKLEFLLEYFCRLCRHSLFNCVQCHKGELDLLLLEMMSRMPRPFVFRGCEFDGLLDGALAASAALPLFRAISLVRSSPRVATRFMLMISPLPDRSFPPIAEATHILLSQFRSTISLFQVPSIHIGSIAEPAYAIDNISSLALESEFTLQLWVKFDRQLSLMRNQKTALVTVSDDNDVGFSLFFSGPGLFCRILSGFDGPYFSAVLASVFPTVEWTMITLSFRRMNSEGSITLMFSFFLNDGPPEPFTVPWPDFRPQPLNIVIGGILDPESAQKVAGTVGYIGAFWCFGGFFTPPVISNTFSSQFRSPDHRCLFGYPAPGCHLRACAPAKRPETLLTALGHNSIFKLFVPFFAYVNEMPAKFAETLVDFMGEVIPREGIHYPVFLPIAHLLLAADPAKLTYTLYLRFFSLIDRCPDAMARQLIDRIVMNFELWIAAEAAVVMRVVTHWATAFLSSCGHFLPQRTLSSLLVQIRAFFWFDPCEGEIARWVEGSPRPRDPMLDISACRQQIDRFLAAVFGGSVLRNGARARLALRGLPRRAAAARVHGAARRDRAARPGRDPAALLLSHAAQGTALCRDD
jgi:hypothetical protein